MKTFKVTFVFKSDVEDEDDVVSSFENCILVEDEVMIQEVVSLVVEEISD